MGAGAARARGDGARGVESYRRPRLHVPHRSGRRAVCGCGRRTVHAAGLRALLVYVREFNLAYRYYPRREHMLRWIGGRLHTEEMLADPKVLAGLGLNQREVRFLADRPVLGSGLALLPALSRQLQQRIPSVRRRIERARHAVDHRAVQEGWRVGGGARLHRRAGVGAAGRLACGHPQAARGAAVATQGVSPRRRQPDIDGHVRGAAGRSPSPRIARDRASSTGEAEYASAIGSAAKRVASKPTIWSRRFPR